MAEKSQEHTEEITEMGLDNGVRIDQRLAEGSATKTDVDNCVSDLSILLREVRNLSEMDLPVNAMRLVVKIQGLVYSAQISAMSAQTTLRYGKKDK